MTPVTHRIRVTLDVEDVQGNGAAMSRDWSSELGLLNVAELWPKGIRHVDLVVEPVGFHDDIDLTEAAAALCAAAAKRRLARIGEITVARPVAFEDLPLEDQENWRDLAAVAKMVLCGR